MSVLEQLKKRQQKVEAKGSKRAITTQHSLLFDWKEAARIPAETIRMLALEGIDQLNLLENRFGNYIPTLFAEARSPRHLMTKAQNDALDKELSAFLSLLSPFFLLGGAHKVLEFLIRKYQVHLYNVDDVIRCCLPYHETNIFVRMLLMMNLGLPEWKFLIPCVQQGVAPSRTLLCNQMMSSKWLLELVCSTPAEAVTHKTAYKSLFSFYVATLVHFFSLNSRALSGNAGEDVLRVLYPFLVSGTKTENEEFKLATYSVLSSLAVAVKLEKTFVSALAEHVIVHALPHHHQQSFVTLLVLLQSLPPTDRSLSTSLATALLEWSNLTKILTTVVESKEFGADLSAFYVPYLSFLASNVTSKPGYVKHVLSLLEQIPSGQLREYVTKLGLDLIEEYLKGYKKMNQDLRDFVRILVLKVDKLFPAELDLAVDAFLNKQAKHGLKEGGIAVLASSASWNALFEGTRHQLLAMPAQAAGADEHTLAVAFSDGLSQTFMHALSPASSPSLTIRALALLKTMPFYSSSEEPALEAVKRSILSLLDPETGVTVLQSLFTMDLHKFLEPAQLFERVTDMLKALATKQNEDRAFHLALTYLAGPFAQKFETYTDPVLLLLLKVVIKNSPANGLETWSRGSSQLQIATRVLSSFHHPLLKDWKFEGTKDGREELQEAIIKSFVLSMGRCLSADYDRHSAALNRLINEGEELSGFWYLVQNHALAISKNLSNKFKLAFLLLSHISHDFASGAAIEEHSGISGTSDLSSVPGLPANISRTYILKKLSGGMCLSPFHLHSVRAILELLSEASSTDKLSYTSRDDPLSSSTETDYTTILATPATFSLLCRLVFLVISNAAPRSDFGELFPKIFAVVGSKNWVDFLSYFWSSPPHSKIKFGDAMQVLCLTMFKAMLDNAGKCVSLFYDNANLVTRKQKIPLAQYLALLLVPLNNTSPSVRMAALECLKQLHVEINRGKDSVDSFSASMARLLSDLLESQGAIIAKGNNIAVFFQNFFVFNKSEPKQPSKPHLPKSALSDLHQSLVTTALEFPHSYSRYIILKALEKVEDRERVRWTLPFLIKKLHEQSTDYYDCLLLEVLLKDYKKIAVSVIDQNEETFKFYTSLLSSLEVQRVEEYGEDGEEEKEEGEEDKGKKAPLYFSPILSLLPNFTPRFFSEFSLPRRQTLFTVLTDLLLPSKKSEIVAYGPSKPTSRPGFVRNFNVAEIKERVREVIKTLPVSPSFVQVELRDAVEQLEKIHNEMDHQEQSGKRQKTEQQPTPPQVSSKVFPPKLTVLLELFQYKSEILDQTHVGPLFSLLSRLLDPVISVINPSSEYTQQLLLSSLIVITQGIVAGANEARGEEMKVEGAEKEVKAVKLSQKEIDNLAALYDVSAIIDCIRVSTNPTIHNNCLLLLSSVALLYPSKVLSHIMPVFTFMGLSTRRSDDNYTFLVLQKTIESVVPAILGATPGVQGPGRRAGAPSESGRGLAIQALLSTMVEQVEEIPQHRRMLVLSILMKTLGFKYLPVLYTFFFSRFYKAQEGVEQLEAPKRGKKSISEMEVEDEDKHRSKLFSEHEKFFGFLNQLTLKFSPFHALHGFIFLLGNLFGILNEENDGDYSDESDEEANMRREADLGIKKMLISILAKYLNPAATGQKGQKDGEQEVPKKAVRNVMFTCLMFLSKYISSESFLGQLLSMPDTMDKRLQELYLRLFQFLLTNIQDNHDDLQTCKDKMRALNKEEPQPAHEAVRAELKSDILLFTAIRDSSIELIDKLTEFLSIGTFINAIAKLLKHPSSRLQRQALLLLNDKLEAYNNKLPLQKYCIRLLQMTKTLVDRLDVNEEDILVETEADTTTLQTAALSIEILTRFLASSTEYADAFVEMVPAILAPLTRRIALRKQGKKLINTHVESSLMLTLATFSAKLREKMLPHLNSLISTYLDILEANNEEIEDMKRTIQIEVSNMAPTNLAAEGMEIESESVEEIQGESEDEDSEGSGEMIEDISDFESEDEDESEMEEEKENEEFKLTKENLLLQISSLSSLHVVFNCHSSFLKSFVNRLVAALLHPALSLNETCKSKVEELLSSIATTYPFTSLQDTIEAVYQLLLQTQQKRQRQEKKQAEGFVVPSWRWYESFERLFSLASSAVSASSPAEIVKHHRSFFKFLLKAFDLRYEVRNPLSKRISSVEESSLASFISFVTKLNETSFRPLMLAVVEWVNMDAEDEGDEIDEREDTRKQTRTKFFFRMTHSLTSSLQSIFVPYFEYFLPNIITALTNDDKSGWCRAISTSGHKKPPTNVGPRPQGEKKSRAHYYIRAEDDARNNAHVYSELDWLLQSLTLCFRHNDEEANFVTVKVFEKLLNPLMQVLETVVPDEEEYGRRIENVYVPCIAQLAVCVAHENLWKSLNYHILLRSRSEEACVRKASLQCIHSFYLTLGEQFLPLLPESMQFIYELMEDTDQDVLEAVEDLRKTLEDILGKEALQDLLK